MLAAVAHAVPLVHDGGAPAEVTAFVAGRTGLPPSQLEPVSLDTLLAALPTPVGAATMRHCAGAPTRVGDLRAHAVRAEAAHREGDTAGAMDELDLGIAGLGCLAERVDAPAAARLFMLRGGLLARAGRDDDARAELRSALSMDPAGSWDEWLPSEGRALFDAVRDEAARSALTVAPADSPALPWVDGQAVPAAGQPLPLRLGLHLVQVPGTAGLRTAWLTVEGDVTLVIPGNYRRPVLERLGEPERAAEVVALVRATVPEAALYASAGGGLWLVSVEGGSTTTTTLVEPPPPPEPPTRRRDRQR